jgi:hypothetical protein
MRRIAVSALDPFIPAGPDGVAAERPSGPPDAWRLLRYGLLLAIVVSLSACGGSQRVPTDPNGATWDQSSWDSATWQ